MPTGTACRGAGGGGLTPAAAASAALLLALLALAPPSAVRVAASRDLAQDARAAEPQAQAQGGVTPTAPIKKVDFHVTLDTAAPDCFERPVILVNGQLGPTLEVTQGDMLELTLHNDLPEGFPNVHRGISIHWHGLAMKGYSWYDGVAYVEMCPVTAGSSFTYRFLINEAPGTYIWHGHSGSDRADGLAGPLIVRPKAGAVLPGAPRYDEERTLFLGDWWHTEGAALAMPLNRPFDSARVTNNSGSWAWVNNPQALLINGRGYYGDCSLGPGGSAAAANCSVTQYWVPPGRSAIQPWASAVNPGCAHENITVEAGKMYLFRIISASALTYQTLCFEGHDVTVVAADATPVQPFKASTLNGCLDINSGQRYDVLLKANQDKKRNYWISTQVQYRPGSPAGYAVLHYKDAPLELPATPPPQPGSVAPWTTQQLNGIRMNREMLKEGADRAANDGVYAEAMTRVPDATLNLQINVTQPLMNQTGQLRWAINNVAGQMPAPCQPLLDLVSKDLRWIQKHLAPAKQHNSPGFNASALGVEEGKKGRVDVFLTTSKGGTAPVYPTAGTHLVPLKKGEVVEMVLQNHAANAANGDYRPAGAMRTAQEQHPFHMHGHSFWVLGQGLGTYQAANTSRLLNTRNPPLRDTSTLPMNGWAVLRFVADNPGLWLFHCHFMWHEYMGQLLVLTEALEELPPRPADMPKCPDTCIYNAAPWSKTFVEEQFGGSGFEHP